MAIPIVSRWKQLSHFWRHATINLLLGVVIEVLIHIFHHAPALQRAENAGLDAAIAFFGARGDGGDPEPGLAFTVLDIDDATWRSWGSPNVTPRDRLTMLLRSATAAGAAAVLLDLDLTRMESANGLTASKADSALAGFLRDYRGPVPILFPRLLRPPAGDTAGQWPEPVSTWFEPADTITRPLYGGTVQFVEEVDGVVRRWRLWEPICEAGRPRVLPSTQLLAAALVDSATGVASLSASLDQMAPERCHAAEVRHAEVRVFGHLLEPGHEQLPERIIYSLPWPPDSGPTRMVRLRDGSAVPALLSIPAAQAADSAQPIDPRLLTGRIVVIGASNAESRDWYATPLGRMPGMMLLVNSIESLRRHGQYGRSSNLLKWIVVGVLLLLTSLAYARYHPLVATLLIIPLIYLAVLPLSFYVFNSGAWLDFTAPILGVQLHELIASAEDAWAQRGKRFSGHP